jgi:hypothetical protein
MLTVQIHETYYGEGEARNGKTYLVVLLEPRSVRWSKPPRYTLVIDGVVPIPGTMVVRTTRLLKIPQKVYDSYNKVDKNGCVKALPSGKPELAVDIAFDPSPNEWRGRMQGEWSVKMVRIKRRTIWQRLRAR